MPDVKKCSKCGISKKISEFYSTTLNRDGIFSHCKICHFNYCKAWKNRNHRKVLDYSRKSYILHPERSMGWHLKNPDRSKENRAKWKKNNPKKRKEQEIRYRARHPDKLNAKYMRRYASKISAAPKWRNDFFIAEAYALAILRTKMFGFDWHVDHIVPLQSKTVCGLHVENNLQVIPAFHNISKSNRSWPDMPT